MTHSLRLAANSTPPRPQNNTFRHDRKGGPAWTQFSYPAGWRYDLLRGLDYFRSAAAPDPRMAEAIEIVASRRDADGRWALGIIHPEEVIAEPGVSEGAPSRWNTLRAMRVLRWFEQSPSSGAA